MDCTCCKINCNDEYIIYEGDNIPDNTKRAGVIIIHNITNHILLVRSLHNKWGFPKGKLEHTEKSRNTAVRELYEETGISITPEQFEDNIINAFDTTLFYIYVTHTDDIIDMAYRYNINEITGMMWINIKCLERLIRYKKIKFNSTCKYALNTYFGLRKSDLQI